MKNSNIKPRSRHNWTLILRRSVQIFFVILILGASLRHNLLEESSITASIDALCPLGGLETLWRMLIEGSYVPKTHPSNLILGIGLLVGTLLAGAAFCGWVCPFGSLQDGLTWLRKKMHLPELRVPAKIDRWLRYGRYAILALILVKTITTVKLWFSGYDPYRTIFGLGWVFEFNLAEQWPAYLIALLVLVVSFWVPRAWCKYACPLGGALSILGHFSILRIRRSAASCKNCAICETSCPVGIAVASASPRLSTNCIGCLDCVQACPRSGALEIQLAPAWLDGLRSITRRLSDRLHKPAPVSGD